MRTVTLLVFFIAMPVCAQQQVSTKSTEQSQTVRRAEQDLHSQDIAGAMREYRAMLTSDPSNSQALTGLGVLLYGSGRATDAVEALSSAHRIDPSEPRAELFLALSQADVQACDKALPVLAKYFALQPIGKLQRLTGLTLLQCSASSNDESAALQAVALLRKNYPGDADVLYQSAEFYTRLWSQTANELLTTHPDSYRVHQLAAEVNEAQGNLAHAITEYRAALAEVATLPQMHYRIGQLLLRIGDADADEKAMSEFRLELAVNPQSAVAAFAMAEIERHQGKLLEASGDYTKALALEPTLQEGRVGLAQTLLARHQVDAALAELRTLIAEHPENAQAHYAMMLAYREQGKLPEADTEMAVFQHLRQGSADQFQKKLDALLSGSKSRAAPGPSSNP